MKSALLIAAHGSPIAGADDDVLRFAADVRAAAKIDVVEACFLECNQPSIPDSIRKCVGAGVDRIVVLPYFLHAGRHVVLDIPAIIDEERAESKGVEIAVADYLGCSPIVAKVLRERAKMAGSR